jgi:hypothetical protein
MWMMLGFMDIPSTLAVYLIGEIAILHALASLLIPPCFRSDMLAVNFS